MRNVLRRVVLSVTALFSVAACDPKDGAFFGPFDDAARDVSAPSIFDLYPAANPTWPINASGFRFSVNDIPGTNGAPASGVDFMRVNLMLNGTARELERDGNTWTGNFDGLPDGEYDFNYSAFDVAGNEASLNSTIFLKRTAPVINFTTTPLATWNSALPQVGFNYAGTLVDQYLKSFTATLTRPGNDGMCGTNDDMSWPKGTGPGQVSENMWDLKPGLGVGGAFNLSFTARNGVAAGGQMAEGRYCLNTRATDLARDEEGNENPNIRQFSFESRLSWSDPFGVVKGVVLRDGQPLANVLVTVDDRTDLTDANGGYRIEGVLAGDRNVVISQIPAGASCSPTSKPAVVTAGAETTVDFSCVSPPGRIFGAVSDGELGIPGVTVTLNGQQVTTFADGSYSFENVPVGTHQVTISVPSGYNCSITSRTVTVSSGATATANFNCTPVPGSISGTVLFNGLPISGVQMLLHNGQTQTTNAQGVYQFSSLAPGNYTVGFATTPVGVACDALTRPVVVTSGGNATANFTCLSPAVFAIAILSSYRHFSGFSRVCALISTLPIQPNAAFLAVVTGPGVSGTGIHNGVLDAQGRAALINTITLFGLYTWAVTIGNQTMEQQVNVTGAAGTCEQ